MRADAGRALGRIGIGADLGVGQHVAGEVVGPCLVLAVVKNVVGGDQVAKGPLWVCVRKRGSMAERRCLTRSLR
jgi:hypothetical protein